MRFLRSPLCLVAGPILTLWGLAGASQAESSRVWSFKPDKGFVDDPLAFSGDDARFAFIHTDSAEFLSLVVMKTEGFAREVEIKIEDATRVPKQLAFTPDGTHLVFIWSDGRTGSQAAALYEVPSGKLLKSVGPATSAAYADCGTEPCLTLDAVKTTAQGAATHAITAFRTTDFKRIGAGVVQLGPDQLMKKPPVRLLYWEPGQLSLVGMKKGDYDRKRDVRLPEQAVRYAVLSKRESWGQEPKDLMEWAKTTGMRPAHPGQYRFVHVSDDLKELLLVDRDNGLSRVTLPVRWVLYEPKSLEQSEPWDGKTLYFSMTVDPVNAEAVKRKKADKERMDLYRLDSGAKVTPLGQVQTGQRKFRWTVGSRHFSYLRKLKGFSRGGNELELYKIAP